MSRQGKNVIKAGDPVLCTHANECPQYCYCPPDCYCRTHTCLPSNDLTKGTASADETIPTPDEVHALQDQYDAPKMRELRKIVRVALIKNPSDAYVCVDGYTEGQRRAITKELEDKGWQVKESTTDSDHSSSSYLDIKPKKRR